MEKKENLLERFKTLLSDYPKEDVDQILKAYEFSKKKHQGQKRASGDEFITHPLSVAINLAEMNVDPEMIIAGLLHDIVEDTIVDLEEIASKFNKNISILVDGVTKISKLKSTNKTDTKSETIRKMLFSMIKDMNIIVIKLADKMHNMSTLNYLPLEKRKKIAKETLEIYAPLAGKMGIHFIKDKLEDYALRWIFPDAYTIIKKYFDRTEKDRERTIALVTRILSEKLKKENISFQIKSRTKHYYSIYKKMKKYNKRIEEIFDLYGIRIITDSVTSCYQIFGIIHNLWRPIPGRFRDFIAHPKKNGYSSLHTTVIIERRKAFEIQIRTEEMEEFNEYGISAHWYYKKGQVPNTDQLRWLTRLKEVHKETLSPEEYYQIIRDDILKDEIYVFSPKGDIYELPKGATAIDFAYHIHTEIGHRCKGAKANGVIIPLNTPLKNGTVVEILTGKITKPKQSWLSVIKTSHARKKIKAWFASNKQDETAIEKIDAEKKDKLIKKQKQKKISKTKEIINNKKINVVIDGEKNLLFSYAKCCNPTPSDQIIGYISHGRGVIIHRSDCTNIENIKDFNNRSIYVSWAFQTNNIVISFVISISKNENPYSSIGKVIQKHKGTVIKWYLNENAAGKNLVEGDLSVELPNDKNIKNITTEIMKIPAVHNISIK